MNMCSNDLERGHSLMKPGHEVVLWLFLGGLRGDIVEIPSALSRSDWPDCLAAHVGVIMIIGCARFAVFVGVHLIPLHMGALSTVVAWMTLGLSSGSVWTCRPQ